MLNCFNNGGVPLVHNPNSSAIQFDKFGPNDPISTWENLFFGAARKMRRELSLQWIFHQQSPK
jgi:hypothetical protein